MSEGIKTLQQLKDEKAVEYGYADYHQIDCLGIEEYIKDTVKLGIAESILADQFKPLAPETADAKNVIEKLMHAPETSVSANNAQAVGVEKPDSLTVFKKHRKTNWDHEWVEDHGALNYTEFKKIYDPLAEEIARLNNDLLDALDLKEGKGPTALSMCQARIKELEKELTKWPQYRNED